MYNLKVISSTTRPGRKGPIVASWIAAVAQNYPELNVELLDLGEINLPMMDEPYHPRLKKYQHEHTKQWSAKIDEADAFIFVTAEYNFGFPAPLKNALDYLSHEWAHKAAGIVSYGGASGGTRAAQMLKQILTTFKVVPLTEAVALPFFDQYINEEAQFTESEIIRKSADDMLKELLRWTEALRSLRQN